MELQSSGPLILLLVVQLAWITSANVADIARKMSAKYELINHNPGGTYYASIILHNRGETPITSAGGWSIYFCHENVIEFERFNALTGEYTNPTSRGGFLLSHIEGCMYKFTPDPARFKAIQPGTHQRITFLAAASISGIFDVYPNFYIADNTQSSAVIPNTKSYRWYVAPFTNIFQYTRDPPRDPILPVSPSRNYMVLANQTFPTLTPGDILPTPLQKTAYSGKVMIDNNWRFYSQIANSEISNLMGYFTAKLRIPITTKARINNVISFKFDSVPNSVENGEEWYSLTISEKHKYVAIIGNTTHGWLNAFQTLLNVIEEKKRQDGTQYFVAPELKIIDAPRFKHRSLLLDVASNFVSLSHVKQLLHMMALVKLNKLQLLLANDYGIRLDITALPGFINVGSKRCHDLTEESCLFSQLGSDPSGQGLGSGYYTVDEYKDLLSLAKQLHIEIIPMWNFDSNMRASEIAIRAYSKATGTKTMDWSLPQLDKTSLPKPNLFKNGKIDICADQTLEFIRTIVSTIKSYHTAANYSLKTFAIGGDDTDPEAWHSKCQFRNRLNNKKHPYVFSKLQFNIKLSQIFVDHDITLNAYDNQFSAFPTRCQNASDCTDWFTPYNYKKWIKNDRFKLSVTHRDPRVMFMTRHRLMGNDTGGGHDRETKLRMFQRTGYQSIISLQDVLDFSIKEEPGPYVQGEMPFGRSPIPLQHVFSMWPESMCCSRYECFPRTNPYGVYAFVRGMAPPLCVEDPRAPGPIGMQASISTKKVLSGPALFQLLFPRLIAFAERAWHRASWENTVKRPIGNITVAQIQEIQDFMKFKTILGKQLLPTLDKNSVQYYLAPPGAFMRKVTNNPSDMNTEVLSKTEYPGFVAQIKTDQIADFEDIVEKKVYGGNLAQFRLRNKDSTRFSRSEVVLKNATNKYMLEHVKLMQHLREQTSLEFPIQTRFRNKDDPTGVSSFSLSQNLPLYFDKDFGLFFNKTGYQEFLVQRPILVEQAKKRQEQHALMIQAHQRRMLAEAAARGNNQNNMNQVGTRPVGNNQNSFNNIQRG